MVMLSLAEILERHFQLLAGFHRRQQVRRDRAVGVAAALLAGLDLQIGDLAVVDLELGARRQV